MGAQHDSNIETTLYEVAPKDWIVKTEFESE